VGVEGSVVVLPGQSDWEIDFRNEIVLLDKLAEGGFGEVHKGLWRGKLVAVKTVKHSVLAKDPRCMKNWISEVTIMRYA